jgi:hypothetical protein
MEALTLIDKFLLLGTEIEVILGGVGTVFGLIAAFWKQLRDKKQLVETMNLSESSNDGLIELATRESLKGAAQTMRKMWNKK